VAFAPDSKAFATGGKGKSVQLWDATRKERIADFPVESFDIISVAFSPDGKLLAAGHDDPERPSRVYLWDMTTRRRLGVWRTREWGIRQLAFSPDGKMLAVAVSWSTGYVELWSVEEMLAKKDD
jgi:WD40 repeat protein